MYINTTKMPESSSKVTIDLRNPWVKAVGTLLVTALLGEGAMMFYKEELFGAEAAEKYAVGVRCDATECVYRDKNNNTFEAKRLNSGYWAYKKQGDWYYVVNNAIVE